MVMKWTFIMGIRMILNWKLASSTKCFNLQVSWKMMKGETSRQSPEDSARGRGKSMTDIAVSCATPSEMEWHAKIFPLSPSRHYTQRDWILTKQAAKMVSHDKRMINIFRKKIALSLRIIHAVKSLEWIVLNSGEWTAGL